LKAKKSIGRRGCECCNPLHEISPTIARAHKVLQRVAATLTIKNAAYGDSAANPLRIFSSADSVEQIKVRIDDKLRRVARGTAFAGEDTLLDLIGYLAILAAIRKEPRWNE